MSRPIGFTSRPVSFEDAKRLYVHRFTMEHYPFWASIPVNGDYSSGRYYAPQYRTDREWYDNTLFPGEGDVPKNAKYCYSTNQSWPMGHFLNMPYYEAKAFAS